MSAQNYSSLTQAEKNKLDALNQKIKAGGVISPADFRLTASERTTAGASDRYLPARFDASGLTSLHWACKVGNASAVGALLNDDNINDLTTGGKSPLELAIEHDHPELALTLLRNPALDRREASEHYKAAFFASIAKEAKTTGVMKENFRALTDEFFGNMQPQAMAYLRNGHYVFSDAEVLEKISQARLDQILAKVVEGRPLTRSLNLGITFAPKSGHKEKLFGAICRLLRNDTIPRDKKIGILRLIVTRNPTASLKGDNSFEAFFWKNRGFFKCKLTSGVLKKLKQELDRLDPPPAPSTTGRGGVHEVALTNFAAGTGLTPAVLRTGSLNGQKRAVDSVSPFA